MFILGMLTGWALLIFVYLVAVLYSQRHDDDEFDGLM